MDTVLIVLTGASVAAAAAFGISAWRSRTEESRRSAARVAALSAAIDGVEAATFDAPAAFATPASAAAVYRPVAVTSMFAEAPGASVSGLPLVKMGVFGALALVLLLVVAMANRDRAEGVVPAGSANAMLELVSMQHTREGRALTVSGLVRNPRTGVPRSDIDAVVSAFDRKGALITSGDAGLDFTNLAPGDESRFVVTLRNASGVARYRVSFRAGDSAVRHVDRRADALQASAK